MTLKGMRVWITRPAEQAEESARVWREGGATATAVPLVELQPIALTAAARETLASLPSPWNVVLTSRNAATSFVDTILNDPQFTGTPTRVHAVGEATAAEARSLGLDVRTTGTGTGADLARAIAPELRGSVLLPGSDRRRPETADVLRASGCVVTEIALYHNRPVGALPAPALDELNGGRVDLVALYSPSAVESFASLTRGTPAATVPTLALGPTTHRRATELELVSIGSTVAPTQSSMLEAAARWWSSHS